MESKILIKLKKDVVVEMLSDSPNIEILVNNIIVHRETIVVNNIEIELVDCKSDDFDLDTFKEIIIELVSDFQNKIQINKMNWDKYKENLNTDIVKNDM